MLTCQYYSRDGIHLSHSGIKRLLYALNRKVNIVANFDLCVYQTANLNNQRTVRPGANMSLTIPNLVPQRHVCYLNFISVAKPQKFGNERMMRMSWQAARHTESKISLKNGSRTR